MNKKIAVVKKSMHGYGGGVELFVACAEEYHSLGYDVSVFVCEASNLEQFSLNKFDVKILSNLDNLPIIFRQIFINLSFISSPITFFIVAFRIAREFSDDSLIHVHESLGPLLAFYLKVLLRRKLKVVWTQNDFLMKSPYTTGLRKILRACFGGAYQSLEKRLSKFLDLTCVLDAGSKRAAINTLSCRILENPVALLSESTERHEFIRLPERYVLCNASYSKHRLFDTVIDAVAGYNELDTAQNLSLVIVGDGTSQSKLVFDLEEHALLKGVELLQIPKRVSFGQLNYLYEFCDFFAFVGENQTWGLAPFKALSLGKPTIVSDGCGAATVLHDRCNVVKTGNISEIIDCFISPHEIDEKNIAVLLDELSIKRYIDRLLDNL